MLSASRCKGCKAVVVRGASHCARCGFPQGMSSERKLFLGFGLAVILVLFFLASRPPDAAEVEYRPVIGGPPGATSATWPLPSAPAEGPSADEGPAPRPGR